MGTAAEQWRQGVEPHFGFVADFGFVTVDVDDGSPWSHWVQYRSKTAAIRISRSYEFFRCEVQLIRLVDGEVPAYPIWITEDRIDWVLLDNVVAVRRPELLADVPKHAGLGPSDLEGALAFWARVLRDVAADFLEGGFGSLDEAGALIRGRVGEDPQQVQVWIPGDAPKGAEAEQVEKARASVPPNVGVSVRRYRRTGHQGPTEAGSAESFAAGP